MDTWGHHIDSLLDKIRLNCVQLTNRHIKNHLYYKGASSYFEIPTIILSVFAGSFAVGSDPFLDQELISVTNCVISMIITILTSVKLYMKIAESASAEQELAISFKSIALDIFKTLSLPEEKRGIDGMVYLNKVYGKYINLVENSAVLNQMNKRDQLLVIDPRMLKSNDENSISSDESNHINPISIDRPIEETL
tara:strand:- start:165 stop:746 length:582 start_codon:yes stop_codon:yes gene_type:complete